MIAWIVLGIIVGIVVLIMIVPVGADIAYENGQFSLSAKACGVLVQILPKKPPDEDKPKKPRKEKKRKAKKKKGDGSTEEAGAAKKKKKLQLNFNRDEIFSLVKKVLKKFGRFGRKFHVDRFLLHYVAAGKDPYDTAVTFAYVNASLSSLAPLCQQRFQVKDCEVWTDIDFGREKTMIDFGLAFSIRIGAFFALAFGIVFSALGIFIRSKLRIWREKRQSKKEQESQSLPVVCKETEENIQNINENTQSEERNDING